MNWISNETENDYIKRELSAEETPSNILVFEEKVIIISQTVLFTKPNITVIKYLNVLLQKQK